MSCTQRKVERKYTAVDLFSGCGGLSCGLEQAGFNIVVSVEIDPYAAEVYRLNHPNTKVLEEDIRNVDFHAISSSLSLRELDLLAGCPPCQGFSTIRRNNKRGAKRDSRNMLIMQYLRAVKELNPKTILLENVPALKDYYLFPEFKRKLKALGYELAVDVLDASWYRVPQRRKRLVLLGSRVGRPCLPKPGDEHVTVRQAIGALPSPSVSDDSLHKVHSHHTKRIMDLVSAIPKNGGSLSDVSRDFSLRCHDGKNIGYSDVYGRMKWDAVAPTITGGCLNPSKGRFLHPEEDRSISAREASLLQTFPLDYRFPENAPKGKIALMIGNAFPPSFAREQALVLMGILNKR